MRNQPDILLITADSLRADRLGCYGYPRPTSPCLDLFSNDAMRFTHAFANGPNTPHSFPAIMAATYPLDYSRLGLFDPPVTLAEALQAAGYFTIGFVAGNPYLSRAFCYDRGFSEFHDYIDASKTLTGAAVAGPGEQIGVPKMALDQYLVSEESVHRKACLENEINHSIFAALERVSRPFFLWVHYMDTHYPYLPQMSHQRDLRIATISRDENFSLNTRIRENMPLSPDLLRSVQSLYDASVRQLDGKIEELLRFLRQRGWYDSSLIVFCADHGEEFQEHGDLQHKSKLYDELLRVPLLIKSPFAASVRRCEQLLSLIQLPPTILSFLEAENPFSERSVFRQNRLSPAEERKFIIAEASYAANGGPPVDHRLFNIEVLPKRFAYRDQFWKLIFDSTKPETLLHNLVNDPFEKTPICDPGFAAGCLEILEGHIRNQEKQRLRDRIARVQKKLLTTAAADAKVITSF